MDYEAALISKILIEKNMGEVLELNLNEDLFVSHVDKWRFLIEFYSKHIDSPPIEHFENIYPDFSIRKVDYPVSFFVEELQKRKVHNLLTASIREAASLLKAKKPIDALDIFKESILKAECEARPAKDVNLVETTEQRLEDYFKIKECGGITGLPSLWEELDKVTLGFQKEELWMIVARGGCGKTWFETILARYHWHKGYMPLVVTKEMAVWQIARRFDSVNAKVGYQRLRSGSLTDSEYKRYVNSLNEMEKKHPFWVTGDDEGAGGVQGIQAKVDKYKPDALYIDGVYLLDDDRKAKAGWQRLGNVAWDLKQLARRNKIPVFITHQFNKEGLDDKGTADTLSYGDIQKWCDGMIGMYQTEDLRCNREMLFKLLKQREGERIEFVSEWDLDTMSFESRSPEEEISEEEGYEEVNV